MTNLYDSRDDQPTEASIKVSMSDDALPEKDDFIEEAEGQLAVDVYQTANDFVIEAPIAGVAQDDIDVGITHESVTIRGSRKKEKEVRDENYIYQECFWGSFARSIILPQEVDVEKSTATLKDGILTIVLPKLERTKSKKIKVKKE